MSNNSFRNLNKLNEEYEDGLFFLAMNDLALKEGEEFLKDNEEMKSDHEGPSPESIKKFSKLLDSYLKKEKKAHKKNHTLNMLGKAAVAMLSVIIIFSTMMLTVQAFRIRVLNFLISIEPEYTSYQLNDADEEQNNAQLIIDWKNAYVPTYIPEGYTIGEMSYSDSIKKITMENTNGSYIIYTEFESKNNITVDTENASLIETVTINGQDGTLSIKDSITTIVWEMDNHLFIVQGQLSSDEAIEIANGVKFIK